MKKKLCLLTLICAVYSVAHAEYGCVVPIGNHNIYTKLCVDRGSDVHVLQAIAKDGTVEELDKYEPHFPLMELAVTEDRFGTQWLSLTYYAEVDRSDGKTYHISIYNLSKRDKVLSGYSTRKFALQDLNGDGYLEHAFFVPLILISYDIQAGWPIVFTLGEEIKLADQVDDLRDNFLWEANSVKNHLEKTCELLSEGPDPIGCPRRYENDILILSRQIELFTPK